MKVGTILLHKDFVFADGTTADKYLIVLGSGEGILLVAKTTSKGYRYRNDHGCQAANHYPAFLLTKGCCCLPLNTWVCLSDFYDLSHNEVLDSLAGGRVYRVGELDGGLTRDLQFCAKSSDDIAGAQEQMIDACLAVIA